MDDSAANSQLEASERLADRPDRRYRIGPLEVVVPGWVRRGSVLVGLWCLFLCIVGEYIKSRFENIFTSMLGSRDALPWDTHLLVFTPSAVWWLVGVGSAATVIVKDRFITARASHWINRGVILLTVAFAAFYVNALPGYILRLQSSLSPP